MTETLTAATVAARLQGAHRAFQDIEIQMADVIDAMRKSGDLAKVCRDYKAMIDGYEAMDKVRKELYAHLEGISRATIPEMLAEEDVSNITLEFEGGLKYRFGKNRRISISMLNKEAGFDWLKANGGEDLIQPTVNSSALSSFGKEFTKSTGKDLPMEVFKTNEMVYTQITKASK